MPIGSALDRRAVTTKKVERSTKGLMMIPFGCEGKSVAKPAGQANAGQTLCCGVLWCVVCVSVCAVCAVCVWGLSQTLHCFRVR